MIILNACLSLLSFCLSFDFFVDNLFDFYSTFRSFWRLFVFDCILILYLVVRRFVSSFHLAAKLDHSNYRPIRRSLAYTLTETSNAYVEEGEHSQTNKFQIKKTVTMMVCHSHFLSSSWDISSICFHSACWSC